MKLLFDDFEGVFDLNLQVLAGLNQWVVDERVQILQNVALVLAEDSEHDLATLLEDTFLFEDSEGIHDVRRESEGHYLRDLQLGTFFEDAIEVDMGHLSCVLVDQNVVSVPITQAYDVANHRPDRR